MLPLLANCFVLYKQMQLTHSQNTSVYGTTMQTVQIIDELSKEARQSLKFKYNF